MQNSIQASTNGVSFRQPTFHIRWNRFWEKLFRQLERNGRVKAAQHLMAHGYINEAKELLKDMP